jgi:hypothetical protein
MDTIVYVRAELEARKGEWIHIARESGVAYRSLCNVVHSRNDPRVSTVGKLAMWLSVNPRTPKRFPRPVAAVEPI